MKTSTFINKSKWPARGEWDDEPDKAQWQDESTGLVCLALRARSHWCGYVGVPEGHSAFQVEYDAVSEACDIDVHGGLTFSGFCQEGAGDDRICHIPESGQPDRVWWLGFDCAHAGDFRPAEDDFRYPASCSYEQYRNLEYVKSECRSLAKQLASRGGSNG